MNVYLIRHGMTDGNKEGRYIGCTDEALCEEGKEQLQELLKGHQKGQQEKQREGQRMAPSIFGSPEYVYASPLKRCLMTADILYPGVLVHPIEDLKECDFGEFEYKNYHELNGNPDYQRFIDEGGECGFPGGEDKKTFCARVCRAFIKAMDDAEQNGYREIAFVVHGGTIMAIMEAFGVPKGDYYSWQVSNGRGFRVEYDERKWKDRKYELTLLNRIT
ncbi:MAG: histidine phosphatase family protein [Lachnospiraceae bacterium]|nr:histidine phosphatase family protein [Lachnospiraceae bacterium]